MRRVAALVVVLALVGACSGDDNDDRGGKVASPTTKPPTTTTEPPPERYREQVFDEVEITRDVVYGRAPGKDGRPEELKLDLYTPVGDDETDRPVAIWVHGGGFCCGDKADPGMPALADLFAKLGYVSASINYRLLAPPGCSGASGAGDCQTAAIEGIHDGQAAVRWFRANAETYGIDPDRIAIGGASAGAIVATGAGLWSDVPGESGTPDQPSEVQAWMSLSGGLPGGLFASAGDAPGILFASTGDPVVPHSWSLETRDALAKVDVPVELVTYEGSVHVPFVEQRDDIEQRTIDFFREHLGLGDE